MSRKKAPAAATTGAVPELEWRARRDPGGLTGAKSEPRSGALQPLKVLVPIRTVNSTNAREHWAVRAKRAKAERSDTAWMLANVPRPELPCTVKFTRIGPNRRAMDGDGLQAALKHVRDQVAEWLGVDDASPLIRWDYWQERAREYAVRIEITQGEGHG